MKYKLQYTEIALRGLAFLKKNELLAYKKVLNLLEELQEHPRTGTGKPKMLRGNRSGQWSRRITDKHRLVYTIEDNILTVLILTACNHYDDK